MFILAISISLVCLAVILLIFCGISPWDWEKLITFYCGTPASSLFGTLHQLTHPPVKSSNLPLRKSPARSFYSKSFHIIFRCLSFIRYSSILLINSLFPPILSSSSFMKNRYYLKYITLRLVYFYGSKRPRLSEIFQTFIFQYFTVTKRRFCTKQVQGTYFENEFRNEKIIDSSSSKPQNTKPSPRQLFISTHAELLRKW